MNFEVLYNDTYINKQLGKFENRYQNLWSSGIAKDSEFVNKFSKPNGEVLELLCSIGSYAFEFALKRYNTFGVDLSPESIHLTQDISNINNLRIN